MLTFNPENQITRMDVYYTQLIKKVLKQLLNGPQ